MLALAVFVGVFAATVWGVTILLDSRTPPPRDVCAASLPDGSRQVLDVEQARNAALISAIALERGLPARAVTIALATAMQESRLINIDYGDRDSLGLFQQRPSQGWGTEEQVMDPFYSTNAFYDGLMRVGGWESMEITVAAQAVQRSAFPNAYAQHEDMARAFASALTGHSPAQLACEVVAPEDPALAPVLAGLVDFGTAPPLAPAVDDSGAVLKDSADRTLFTLDATALTGISDDPARAAWAGGHWLVATATESGAATVIVGDRLWSSSSLSWEDAGELTQAENVVLVG